ncbi:MAG: DUF4919 domain-containing protein [Crocinitomicaceae bacterium]|nr:DUF4919 domain-containing protein [Crocinitomicaceae bacterium]
MTRLNFVILLSFFIISSAPVVGQNIGRIDFSEIKKEIENPESNYYYPSLLERIHSDDTTLNYSDYKYLYYGNVFQENYHPYGITDLKKEFNTIYKNRDYKNALLKGKDVLAENPVDIEVTLKMIIACLETGDTLLAKIYGKKYFGFLDVIYASGDGKSLETAYVVISVDDEYRIVGDLGLYVKQQVLINDCDLLIFEKKSQRKVRKKKIKELYFNVQMPLLSFSDSFKDADLPDPDPEDEEDEDPDE